MEPYFSFTMNCTNRENVLTAPIVVAWEGKTVKATATFDTGATRSCISQKIVNELNLIPVDKERISFAREHDLCSIYKAHIGFTRTAIAKNFKFAALEKDNGLFEVLIGMDLLAIGDFMFTNYGDHTVFSFRMPSQESQKYSENTISEMETTMLLRAMRHINST